MHVSRFEADAYIDTIEVYFRYALRIKRGVYPTDIVESTKIWSDSKESDYIKRGGWT